MKQALLPVAQSRTKHAIHLQARSQRNICSQKRRVSVWRRCNRTSPPPPTSAPTSPPPPRPSPYSRPPFTFSFGVGLLCTVVYSSHLRCSAVHVAADGCIGQVHVIITVVDVLEISIIIAVFGVSKTVTTSAIIAVALFVFAVCTLIIVTVVTVSTTIVVSQSDLLVI